jgi:hypothetical protein
MRPFHAIVLPGLALACVLAALPGCGGPRQDVVRSSTSEAWAADAYAGGAGREAERARAARVCLSV